MTFGKYVSLFADRLYKVQRPMANAGGGEEEGEGGKISLRQP